MSERRTFPAKLVFETNRDGINHVALSFSFKDHQSVFDMIGKDVTVVSGGEPGDVVLSADDAQIFMNDLMVARDRLSDQGLDVEASKLDSWVANLDRAKEKSR